MILQLVLHIAYDTCRVIADYLQESSTRFVACQHDADEEIATTHTHFSIDWPYSVEALRKQVLKHKLGGKGQYVIMTVTQKGKQPYDYDKLNTYILKGNLATLKKSKALEQDQLTKYVADWVIPVTKESAKKPDQQSQWDIITQVVEETKKMGLWTNACISTSLGLETQLRIKDHEKVFTYLVKKLNEARIRTSRNELERIYVSVLRHDSVSTERIFSGIYKNIFRES